MEKKTVVLSEETFNDIKFLIKEIGWTDLKA